MSSSYVDSDPSIAFSTGVALATATFSGAAAPTAPALQTIALAGPIGPMIDVTVTASSPVGVATVEVALSIDLVGRRR